MTSEQALQALREAIWGQPASNSAADFPPGLTDTAARQAYAATHAEWHKAALETARNDQAYWDGYRYSEFWRLARRVLVIAYQRNDRLPDLEPPPIGLNTALSDWVERLAQ